MLLLNKPVTQITSLAVSGLAIVAATGFTDNGYRLAGRKLLLNTAVFPRGSGNVVVAYQAGYATTPPDVEQACIELVAIRYQERQRIGLTSKGMAGETTAYMVKDMPDSVRTLLMQYREVVPV